MLKRSLLVIALLAASPAFGATTYTYSDYVGTDFKFSGIQETVHTGTEDALFEAPTGVGNDLTFDPSAFIASSSGGVGGINEAHSTLQFMVEATGIKTIEVLQINELGDYTFGSFPPVGATAATGVLAALGGVLTVTEVNGIGITPVLIGFDDDDDVVFTNLGIPFPVLAPGAAFLPDAGLGTTSWGALLQIDVAAQVVGATKAILSFNNILQAASETSPNTSAQIQKKRIDGPAVFITAIPEPSLPLLLAGALLALGLRKLC